MTCRVAHVTTVDTSLRYLLLDQIHSARAEGYEVVGISTPGPDVSFLEAEGVCHIPVKISRNVSPFEDVKALWRLYTLMRRERFTIVHTHTPKAGLLGQLAARLAGVPIVVNTLHGFYFHEHMRPLERRLYIALEKLAALCSDVILSQNREDLRTAIAAGICGSERIKHLGNGIDLIAFDPARVPSSLVDKKRTELGIPAGAKVVGFVGRLAGRRKGFLDFLAAAQQIARRCPDARFLVVGEPDRGKPDAVDPTAAKEYGIEGRSVFVGTQPNDRLPLLYRLMDVLVLPSLFEGMPRVIMEAAAMRVPAVASNVKGNRETVVDSRTGLLVPLGDVPALSEAILTLLNDSNLARRMGLEGRKVAEERFDEQRVFAKVNEEYRRLIEEKGIPVLSRNTGPHRPRYLDRFGAA